ncbi:MAG: hypothetical protein ABSD75_29685 [Terriglobales bacterium]|jgi:hypothetical protein
MAAPPESVASVDPQTGRPAVVEVVDKSAVFKELENILASPPFRNSSRSKQFLSYVVQHKLGGHGELLKERSIGADLFHRPADYATGDDPVVRVQAGEVRRRLEQYYHESSKASEVRIDLPVGSYVPEFHRTPVGLPIEAATQPLKEPRNKWKMLAWTALAVNLVLAAVLVAPSIQRKVAQPSALQQFWTPFFSTSQPVLICLPKPIFYRPSFSLYDKYSKTHPGTFQTQVERFNQPLPLDPEEKILWGDMLTYPDFGLVSGDVYAAFRISEALARIGKPSQLRIGNESSFDELRNSPAVLIGAFSNRWTMEMTSDLRFVFEDKDGILWIHDRTSPEKKWFCRLGLHREVISDFGVVTRLLDSKTGHSVVSVAGITAPGTDAAAQFVSNPEYLSELARTAPHGWEKKNMQVVVQTSVIDAGASPPRVVASYFW